MIDTIWLDVRYASRGLRRAPAFTAAAVLTLATGIGLVAALFAIINAVLLDPIVPDQDRAVRVGKLDTGRGGFPYSLALPEFREWQAQTRSFEAVAAIDHAATGPVPIEIDGQVLPATLAPVSADFFSVVHRGQPLLGRWLQPTDEARGADIVAVVSERFWRRVGGGDPAFVGRRLSWAGNRTLVVVGVAPGAVDYPLGTELWAPAATIFDGEAGRFDARNRTFAQFELVGRLRPGVSRDQLSAELTVIHRRVAEAFPDDYQPMAVAVEPLLDSVVGNGRQVLVALSVAAALVFAIAGVNVAALLLMRALGRRPEMAARIALGASHRRLLGQTVTEGLAIGLLGAAGGMLLARALLALAIWIAPADVPRLERAALDPRVVLLSVAAALAWVLVLGTAPAWAHRRLARAPGAGHSARGAVRGTRGLVLFTVAEISAAVIVAIGAGLLVRTFANLQAIERGFESSDLSVVSLLLPEARQRNPRAMAAFYEQLLPEVEALPGVVSASPTHVGPGSGALGLSAPMRFDGQTPEAAKTNPWSTWEPVLPSYFRTLGIPIVRGREFTTGDREGTAPVAVVSESVARQYWPGQEPIGKRLQFVDAAEWPWVTVVGVAADTRYRELTKSWMTVYFPADQFFFFRPASLVVRGQSRNLAAAVLQRVRTIEPGATIQSVTAMDTVLARELARPLTAMSVTGGFALAAILLAAIGVYGVMSYEVRERRREFAVRSAIGATAADLARDVVRRCLMVGSAGGAIGLVAAASLTHTLSSLLYGVSPIDFAVFLTGAAVLFGVVLAAAYFPARRAASLDPVEALRAE